MKPTFFDFSFFANEDNLIKADPPTVDGGGLADFVGNRIRNNIARGEVNRDDPEPTKTSKDRKRARTLRRQERVGPQGESPARNALQGDATSAEKMAKYKDSQFGSREGLREIVLDNLPHQDQSATTGFAMGQIKKRNPDLFRRLMEDQNFQQSLDDHIAGSPQSISDYIKHQHDNGDAFAKIKFGSAPDRTLRTARAAMDDPKVMAALVAHHQDRNAMNPAVAHLAASELAVPLDHPHVREAHDVIQRGMSPAARGYDPAGMPERHDVPTLDKVMTKVAKMKTERPATAEETASSTRMSGPTNAPLANSLSASQGNWFHLRKNI